LRQLLVNLDGGKGFHQVVIGSSDERSLQVSHTWLRHRQHNDPGIFDRLLAQPGYKVQAIYLAQCPIDQHKVRSTHRAQDIHSLLTIVGFGYFKPTHG
jgi:hypothetical protein